METTHDRPVRKRRASPSVELGTAVSFALAAVVVLPGIIAGFLRREVKNNDTAHAALRADVKALRADIKKLLTGDAPGWPPLNNRIDRPHDLMPGRQSEGGGR